MANDPTTVERDYHHRCATCRHNVWQNDATGDCQVFHKDVLHEDVQPCPSYEGLTQ